MNRWRLAALAVLAVTMSCRDTTAPIFDLATARARWHAQNLHTYEFTLQRSCFCMTDPLHVTVANDTVSDVLDLKTGASITRQAGQTVEDLFAFIQSAIDNHAHVIHAEFDASKGFPISIDYDGSAQAADDEVSIRVSDLHPLLAEPLANAEAWSAAH